MTNEELSDRLHDLALLAEGATPQRDFIAPILALAFELIDEFRLPSINGRKKHGRPDEQSPQDPGPSAG